MADVTPERVRALLEALDGAARDWNRALTGSQRLRASRRARDAWRVLEGMAADLARAYVAEHERAERAERELAVGDR